MCVDNKKEQTELKATNIISLFHNKKKHFFLGKKGRASFRLFKKGRASPKRGRAPRPAKTA